MNKKQVSFYDVSIIQPSLSHIAPVIQMNWNRPKVSGKIILKVRDQKMTEKVMHYHIPQLSRMQNLANKFPHTSGTKFFFFFNLQNYDVLK